MSDHPPNVAGVREGEILAGKYRIDKILGVGGMGVVVAAHHIDLDERVAIKFLLPSALASTEAVTRFAREARAAVKIKSEHVAKVADVGKLESGAPYMVMEYLEGSDLSSWLAQRGALSVEQAIEFVLQACEALAEAHALGIVHRDLKPANLFVIRRADGSLSAKVLDFGISKATGLSGSGGGSMTQTASIMGSPLYMSPEQMQSSKNVDARGDIWALGVILYELIAGSTPFTGESMPELVLNIVSGEPPPLRNKRPDAPPGLEAIIRRCLEKDRGKRYQTVGELAIALAPFAPHRSRLSIERIAGVMRAAGLSGTAFSPPSSDAEREPLPADAGTAGSWSRTATGSRRGRLAAFLGVGAALVIGGGLAALRKPPPSEAVEVPSSAGVAEHVPETATATPAPAAPPPAEKVERAPVAPVAPAPPLVVAEAPRTAGKSSKQAVVPKSVQRALAAPPAAVPPPPPPVTPPAPVAPVRPAPAPAKTTSIFDDRN